MPHDFICFSIVIIISQDFSIPSHDLMHRCPFQNTIIHYPPVLHYWIQVYHTIPPFFSLGTIRTMIWIQLYIYISIIYIYIYYIYISLLT